jgi:hypothetical protein
MDKKVYLAKAGPFYKVGVSSNPGVRVNSLQIGCPYKIELQYTIECESPYKLEKAIHDRYSNRDGFGEWFQLDDHDLDDIFTYKENWESFIYLYNSDQPDKRNKTMKS